MMLLRMLCDYATMMYIRLRTNLRTRLADERGAVDIIAIVIMIAIAVALAVLFRKQIGTIVNKLFQQINEDVGSATEKFTTGE